MGMHKGETCPRGKVKYKLPCWNLVGAVSDMVQC
jgi:hypothetical protein